jgi:prepilin-type N-terminal cleavage/methylation domain-containing protein
MIVLKIMKTNTKKGFTLIELLVVIAIIGILSSVVLASLNSARNKGADAAVKGNLGGIRAQAELVYDSNNSSYSTLCSDTNVVQAINAAKSAAGITASTNTTYGTAQSASTAVCHVGGSPEAWAISVPLKSSNTTYVCVDSTGNSTTTTTTLSASDATCG